MSINFEGLEELLDKVDRLANKDKIEAGLKTACALVEGEARKKAPKDTGDLRRSIESKVENLEGIVFTPLEYAPYVEYGTGLFAENGGRSDVPWAYRDEETNELIFTSGQKPQPFMRPALDENKDNILRIIRESLTND